MRSTAGRGRARALWLFDDAPILGGAELFALRLALFAREERGLTVHLVCPPGEFAARCKGLALETVLVAFPPLSPAGAPRWPGAILRVRSLLAKIGTSADGVVVANTARAQAYLAAAVPILHGARQPPLVNVVHEQGTLARRSGRFAFRRVGSLVAIGENVARSHRERLPGVPVWKANNFPDPSHLNRPARRSTPAGRPVVGVLTRLIPEKGVLELVDELANAQSWSRAVIAGDAEDRAYADRVEARIGSLGLDDRVSLVGRVEVDEVPSFLDSIDVLAVPSTGSEAQPTVILEALAAGRPCLVRPAVWSRDFEGLPVLRFGDAEELERHLAQLPSEPAPVEELRHRFGPEQALDAILAAASGRRQ